MGTKHLQTGIALGVVLGLLFCARSAAAQEGQKPPDGVGSGVATPEDSKAAEREALNKVAIEDPFKPRYIVEAIEVKGNEYTRGDLIISHLFLRPGESLDEEKVELSRIRLLALGYFKDVRMRLEKGSLRGRVKLIVEVEERNTWIVDDLFIGWSDTNPFWGGLGVSDINFLGRGLVLSMAVVGSEHQWGARLGFFWPSVLGTSFQTGIQALGARGHEEALIERMAPNGKSGCDEFVKHNQNLAYYRGGGIYTAGIRLDRFDRVAIDLHVEYINASRNTPNGVEPSDAGVPCANYPFLGYIKTGSSILSTLTLRFERDTRDDFFLPTHGMYLTFSIELASKILGSSYEFSKYLLRYEHSFPAFLDHAVRFSIQGGLIQDVGQHGSPFFSRFFVGDYAMFWFHEKTSLPRNLELNFSETTDYGDVLAAISAEYDIPLWSGGRFFYRAYVYAGVNFTFVTKAAFLATDEEWSGRAKYPFTVDFGMKFDTPIGLFTLSLGYILDASLP